MIAEVATREDLGLLLFLVAVCICASLFVIQGLITDAKREILKKLDEKGTK